MKQEYKELLFKDLCARLPYGVIVTDNRHGDSRITEIDTVEETVYCDDFDEYVKLDKCKPYLRPISSMTEEEKRELAKITNSLIGYDEDSETVKSLDFYGDARLDVGMEIWMKAFDWLNKKMFAYRTYNDKNMFELGLAIPAPEGMYK